MKQPNISTLRDRARTARYLSQKRVPRPNKFKDRKRDAHGRFTAIEKEKPMTTEPPSKIWVYGTGVTDFSYRGWDVQSLDPSEVYYHIPDELVERLKLLENITIVPAFAKDSLLALLSIIDGEL